MGVLENFMDALEMKNAGEAMPSSGVSREVGSAAASWNQYKARFQAICGKWIKGMVILVVIGSAGPGELVRFAEEGSGPGAARGKEDG
jgi:hypothetical protein